MLPVRSDWDATAFGLGLGADARLPDLRAMFRADAWESEEATETWTLSGREVQENRMRADGHELRLTLAPGSSWDQRHPRWQPFLGLAWSQREYLRDRFESLAPGLDVPGPGVEVTETTRALDLSVGTRWDIALSPAWRLYAGAEAARVLWSEAENDGFGLRIDGDGGWRMAGEVGLRRQLSKVRGSVGLGVSASSVRLDGGRADGIPVEWPESRAEDLRVALSWQQAF